MPLRWAYFCSRTCLSRSARRAASCGASRKRIYMWGVALGSSQGASPRAPAIGHVGRICVSIKHSKPLPKDDKQPKWCLCRVGVTRKHRRTICFRSASSAASASISNLMRLSSSVSFSRTCIKRRHQLKRGSRQGTATRASGCELAGILAHVPRQLKLGHASIGIMPITGHETLAACHF